MKQNKVRLSQCMIVKNEEQNIRQALSWGKGVVCEQIVVDTGSTDDTVRIATELGATVYHFPWINDFSAAKNFAIEKASGNWIAFLDADESLTEEDTHKLITILETMEKSDSRQLIRTKMAHLDSHGKITSVSLHERVFRNEGRIRYQYRIHEELCVLDGTPLLVFDAQDEIMIMHTGYSKESYETTGKRERNIQMLEAELEQDPNNGKLMAYLADSLATAERLEQACIYYQKVLALSDEATSGSCKIKSAVHMMQILVSGKVPYSEQTFKELYLTLQKLAPEHPDANYYTAQRMIKLKKTQEAISHMEIALKKLDNYKERELVYTVLYLEKIYIWLAKVYYAQEQHQKVVHYSVLALRMNPYLDGVLGTILLLFKKEPGQSENPKATVDFLSKIYNFEKSKDQLFVYKCAKIASFYSLEDAIYELFSPDIKSKLIELKQSYIPVGEVTPYFTICNQIDAQYDAWCKEVSRQSYEEMLRIQKEQLEDLKLTLEHGYHKFIEYFQPHLSCGTICPETDNYQVLERRALTLIEQVGDFGWLYGNLNDYRSKTVLLSIMKNWTYLDYQCLNTVKSMEYSKYFDLDLMPGAHDEVFVDIGAGNGDTVIDFINTYGNCYQHIYCYEGTIDSMEALKRNTQYYDNITIVEGISIEQDISEPVTFIKIDVEGEEQDALRGCKETIQKYHPKLAISVHYHYEDLWKIPKMIQEMDSSYKFYLRYYGGNLIPTEIVLYAL